MGRKKAFIDKKTAHRFVLMHRSQQDPLYHAEGGSKLVLHPADAATARALHKLGLGDSVVAGPAPADKKEVRDAGTLMSELREVDEMGFPIDGYDYRRHLSSIQGGGTFVGASGKLFSSSDVAVRAPPRSVRFADADADAGAGVAAREEEEEEEVAAEEESGDELSRPAPKGSESKPEKKGALALPAAVFASDKEYSRMLEAITLDPRRMDLDMRVLLGEEEPDEALRQELDGCVDTLEDDFMQQLMTAEAEGEGAGKESASAAGFDFDAHVARLMAKAAREDEAAAQWAAMGGVDDGDEDADEGEMERALDEIAASRPVREVDSYFDRMLEEYGDDEIGELEHAAFDERVGGQVEADASHVQDALQEFAQEDQMQYARWKEIGDVDARRFVLTHKKKVEAAKEAKAALAGACAPAPPAGAAAQDPPSSEARDATGAAPASSTGESREAAEGDETESDLDNDEDYDKMVRHFGYENKPKAAFDAETIVSTYSVLDNHPALISVPGRRSRKAAAKAASVAGGSVAGDTKADAQDQLEAEKGQEEEGEEEDEDEDELDDPDGPREAQAFGDTSVPRDRNETPEEKRARKQLLKEGKRMRRAEKKSTKQLFKQERTAQSKHVDALRKAAAPPDGVTAYRF
jgi:protein LTV1